MLINIDIPRYLQIRLSNLSCLTIYQEKRKKIK